MLTVILLMVLTACSRYSSHYRAVAFVHSNEKTSAFMSFSSFEGRMVFRLRSSGDGEISYTAELGSGDVTVYYDAFGTKEKLFSVSEGEKLSSGGGYVGSGTVYIIVETDGECHNGNLHFRLKD